MRYIVFDRGFFNEVNDRHRVIEGLNNRDEANRLKQFEFDGTTRDYNKQVFNISNPREQRQIIRYEAKHKDPPEVLANRNPAIDPYFNKTMARYSNMNRAIGINMYNKNRVERAGGTIQPAIDHETQHYNQDMIARKNFGVQGSRMMFNKEYDRYTKGKDNYAKSSLEYNANAAGNKYPCIPTYKDTENIVSQNIQSARYSGPPKQNIDVETGRSSNKLLFDNILRRNAY